MGNLNQEVGVLTFNLEGRFIGFVGNLEEKPKRLRVATAEGEQYIKLSKELRSSLWQLQPGDWVEVSGEQKRKDKTGELKLKAYQIKAIAPTKPEKVFQPPNAAPKTKACIMVCQKSSCRKRGAGEVCQAVTESLRDRGLEEQVALKGTGCMKECKKGPCVVFMPDKSRYTGVAPKEVSTLIEKHFAAKKPATSQPALLPVT